MNRNHIIAGSAILVILILIVIGYILFRNQQARPRIGHHLIVTELGYCSSKDVKPCVMSFSLDPNNNMLVHLLTPETTYPDIYLTINAAGTKNKYECEKTKGVPIYVNCSGNALQPGGPFQFKLIASEDKHVLAEGSFSIIGLQLIQPSETPTPGAMATGTVEPTITPTSTPLKLKITTPTPLQLRMPTATRQSYPNPSYPNQSYP